MHRVKHSELGRIQPHRAPIRGGDERAAVLLQHFLSCWTATDAAQSMAWAMASPVVYGDSWGAQGCDEALTLRLLTTAEQTELLTEELTVTHQG